MSGHQPLLPMVAMVIDDHRLRDLVSTGFFLVTGREAGSGTENPPRLVSGRHLLEPHALRRPLRPAAAITLIF